jgi:hypothetical protein
MPSNDDKTDPSTPDGYRTDPDGRSRPATAVAKGLTLKMPNAPVRPVRSVPEQHEDATILDRNLDRTDPGGPDLAALLAASEETPPPAPAQAPGATATNRVDPDRLLQALSSYRRPEKPVESAASSGAAAARYAGAVHDPAPATRTPAPLPAVLVERTFPPRPPGWAAQPASAAPALAATPPPAAPQPARRFADTAPSVRPLVGTGRAEHPEPRRRGAVIAVAVGIACVAIVGVAARVLMRRPEGPAVSLSAAPASSLLPPLASATALPEAPPVVAPPPSPPISAVSSATSNPPPAPSPRPSTPVPRPSVVPRPPPPTARPAPAPNDRVLDNFDKEDP